MVRRALFSVFGLLLLACLPLATAGCGDSPSTPSDYAPYSQIDLVFGDGATAEAGKLLTVNYTGWFYDPEAADKKGLVFSSTAGAQPFTFTAGANQVIRGWDQGVLGMKVGGLRRLIIPPSLGYGPYRYSTIPPNSTLVFEIELLAVE